MKIKHSNTSNSWFLKPPNDAQAKLRLFCFPYAGARAVSFHPWLGKLPSLVEVCCIELPGRGQRIKEPAFTNLDPLLEELTSVLLPHLNRPFAFFGHSMGALICFELAQLLQQRFALTPAHLFVSGRRAPQINSVKPPINNLSELEFLHELSRFGGTPKALLNNSEMMRLLLPILRADFALLENYVYNVKPRLNCPITALGGLQDWTVNRDELDAWQEQTNSSFTLHMLSGDHFFINSSQSLLLQIIAQELQVWK